MNIIDAEWTPVKRSPTREQRKRRKRAICRDVVLIALVILIPICVDCLANYLVSPARM